ncbi:MAG: ADP-ribosylglycohydrolase family protein [Pirellulaceae bacterium]
MKYRRFHTCFRASTFCGVFFLVVASVSAEEFRRLSLEDYRDKMAGGWIGQMAGVGWGGPTEFKWKGEIIPEEKMPKWEPALINQFHQDDIYVEMTFLRTLEVHGWDVSIRQAGIDFANSGYPLWHANRAGRDNLRAGIAPPDSGHPEFNRHADDIDYQIEADYAGLIAPGMPNVAIQLGEKFGRLMNHGDGLYGGQFVSGMYTEAFFENDPMTIVEAGLDCIPAGSQYAECIRDTIRWYKQHPDDWKQTWEKIEAKYQDNPDYRRFSCSRGEFNIDAKINGAYIVMGLLYGNKDMDQTIIISTRCGQDSDCNPSNAGGVLGTVMGRRNLPEKFTSAIDPNGKFSHTPYTFPALVTVSEKLARQAVRRAGGRVEKDSSGKEVLAIPVEKPNPSPLEQCWEPGPPAGTGYTQQEMEKITGGSVEQDIQAAVDDVLPGWNISKCGPDMDPGKRDQYKGRDNVLVTHPLNRHVACVLGKTVDVPAEQSTLRLIVTHDTRGDWLLVAKADGKRILTRKIDPETVADDWATVDLDLSEWAGESVKVELLNQADDWSFEAGYWAEISWK